MYSDCGICNSVVGSHQPADGPFAPLHPAGYGNPGGLSVNMLRNRPLADGRPGNCMVMYQIIPNDACVVGDGDLGAVRSAGPNAATYDGMSANE